MKIKTILCILTFLPLISIAQRMERKKFTIEQAVLGLYTDLKIASLDQLQFCGDSEYYSYIRNQDGKENIYTVNPSSHEPNMFLQLDDLNKLLEDQQQKTLKTLPALRWTDSLSFYFHHDNNTYFFTKTAEGTSLKKLWSLPTGSNITAEDPNKAQLAFAENHNLFIATTTGNIKITDDGNENIVYGQAVHRNEFGINGGSFWSPKSNMLAFYRMDQSMVADYPIIDWSATPATVSNIKYPMAGGKSHHVTLGIYDIKNKTTKYLNIAGPEDQYLTAVSWSPDEKYIYVGVLSRNQKHLDLNKYSTETGLKVATVFTEENDKYVEPQHQPWFYNNKPGEFVWLSQRDGFMHMYLYQDDTFLKQLTKGDWIVNETLGYNKERNEIIFTSTMEDAMQHNIYAVKIDDGNIKRLSATNGWHYPILSKNANQLIDQYKNYEIPNNIDIINLSDPSLQKRLLTARNPLEEYETAKVKLIKLRVENNILLNGKLVYPLDFDSNKHYPAIIYTYNGPHVQLVKDQFPYSSNLWYDYMAAKGYFIFMLDGRGSSNRGFDFESATHHKLGEIEMRDQMKGVEFLSSLPYIDTKRLGIHGWSFGGYMTTSLMTKYPDVFKAGVAGGPVMDWAMYEIMYTERYMGSPDSNSNAEGYSQTQLWDKTKQLKNKLLLIHGAQDDVVVWQHSMKFIRNAEKNGKQVDYYVYPSHPHNVRGRDRVHLMQKISDYFDTYLK